MAGKLKLPTSLFNNPALSDVKIRQTCNGKTREYYAHKAILCNGSDYFMNAFTGKFKEASDSEMEIHDDDPDNFEFVLKFLYDGDYDKDAIEKMSNSDKDKRISISLGIYLIADKYGIERLYAPAAGDILLALKSVPVHEMHETLLLIVNTHYQTILDADTSIGKMLVSFILDQDRDIIASDDFRTSMEFYPVFAADIALGLSRGGFLKFKPARCSCGWTIFHDPAAEKAAGSKKVLCYNCNKWLYNI